MSAELGARADLDAYMRGCQTLENWTLSQMGGVKRRPGMRWYADCAEGARLFAFIYSYSGEGNRFLVVLEPGQLRVLDEGGEEAARFESKLTPEEVHALQINALMLLTSANQPPMALEVDSEFNWTYKEYEIDEPAWRYDNEKRDTEVVVTKKKDGYIVDFDEEEEEGEVWQEGDELRASFWTEQQEAKATTSEVLDGVKAVNELCACEEGDKIAVRGETTRSYWICIKEWPRDVYREGLEDPDNYPDNFAKADNIGNYSYVTEVNSMGALGGTVAVNTKFCFISGYWEYYTCIKKFTALDIVGGATKFSDYPGHFVRGIAIGEALPCRGAWNFYCAGAWYGSYEVRKNYESADIASGEWECCGISFSRLGSGSNEQLSGDESDKECYLRLFITRSRWIEDGRPQAGFPPENCGNRLIVPGYRHDMRLAYKGLDEDTEQPLYDYVNKVKVDWEGVRNVENWSWMAWSQRNGYPALAAICQQRLCFAGTREQPQTVWMSQVDDIGNFMTGESDDAAIVKTMYSTSQNPIAWMYENRNMLLCGTAEAEWTIGSSQSALTPTTSPMTRHTATGSENGELALQVESSVLFIERGSGRCYASGYSFEYDGYRTKDLTVFAPHVLQEHGGAVQATLLRKPDQVAVYALADGQVGLMTYNQAHEVNAWHRWVTEGRVTSVCAMPNGVENDRLFLVVKREGGTAIEVVEEGNGYVDNGENDYYSTLVTNALNNPLEEMVRRQPKSQVRVKFGDECRKELLEIRVEGTDWVKIAKEEVELKEGWNMLLGDNNWTFENCVGLRFRGNEGCHILALQG